MLPLPGRGLATFSVADKIRLITSHTHATLNITWACNIINRFQKRFFWHTWAKMEMKIPKDKAFKDSYMTVYMSSGSFAPLNHRKKLFLKMIWKIWTFFPGAHDAHWMSSFGWFTVYKWCKGGAPYNVYMAFGELRYKDDFKKGDLVILKVTLNLFENNMLPWNWLCNHLLSNSKSGLWTWIGICKGGYMLSLRVHVLKQQLFCFSLNFFFFLIKYICRRSQCVTSAESSTQTFIWLRDSAF